MIRSPEIGLESRAMSRIPRALRRTTVALGATVGWLAVAIPLAQSTSAEPQQQREVIKVEVKEVRPANAPVEKAAPPGAIVAAPLFVDNAFVVQAAQANQADPTMIRQFAAFLRLEMRVLTAVTNPTPAQRREIALAGGVTVKEVVKNLAAPNNGVRVLGRAANRSDPRKLIHDSVVAAAKAKLSPEQWDRLQKESENKAQDRREAVLQNVVTKLDQLLILTPEQRSKLENSLRTRWDDRVYPQLEMLTAYENYFPAIPENQISPLLTETQRRVWGDVQKINFSSIRMANGFAVQGQLDLPEEEDADVQAALAEEIKR